LSTDSASLLAEEDLSFTKVLDNVSTVSQDITLRLGPTLFEDDSASVSQSGQILSQNYTSEFYFADDYVGQSTFF